MSQQAHGVNPVSDAERALKSASEHAPGEGEVSVPAQLFNPLESVAVAYVIVLTSLAETLFEHTVPIDGDVDSGATALRRREICAAVWAANRAALDASNLSASERALFGNLVWRRLVLHWQSFCGSIEEGPAWLESRSADYLPAQTRMNAVETASHILKHLFRAMGANEQRHFAHLRVLASLVGHRISSEVDHLNELKSQSRFV